MKVAPIHLSQGGVLLIGGVGVEISRLKMEKSESNHRARIDTPMPTRGATESPLMRSSYLFRSW